MRRPVTWLLVFNVLLYVSAALAIAAVIAFPDRVEDAFLFWFGPG